MNEIRHRTHHVISLTIGTNVDVQVEIKEETKDYVFTKFEGKFGNDPFTLDIKDLKLLRDYFDLIIRCVSKES